jgi:excisionase family DNA binding protein
MANEFKLISVPAAAAILSIPVQRVYAMIRSGVLPPGVAVHFGRVVRIDLAALRAFIANGGATLDELHSGEGRLQ